MVLTLATNSQYILPDTLYYNNSSERFNNKHIKEPRRRQL